MLLLHVINDYDLLKHHKAMKIEVQIKQQTYRSEKIPRLRIFNNKMICHIANIRNRAFPTCFGFEIYLDVG